jgi:hypothetical protein
MTHRRAAFSISNSTGIQLSSFTLEQLAVPKPLVAVPRGLVTKNAILLVDFTNQAIRWISPIKPSASAIHSARRCWKQGRYACGPF